MLFWFRRNFINIVVAVIVSVPICMLAHNERMERGYIKEVWYDKPIYLETETVGVEDMDISTVSAPIDSVSYEDIDLLAHLIYAEAGSSWIKDETIFYVGSVVLNRVNSKYYPNTLYEVIYQEGQYECTWNGHIEKVPDERCYEIAEELLRYGSVLPENVLYQAQFEQGSGVYSYQDNLYFCYY